MQALGLIPLQRHDRTGLGVDVQHANGSIAIQAQMCMLHHLLVEAWKHKLLKNMTHQKDSQGRV